MRKQILMPFNACPAQTMFYAKEFIEHSGIIDMLMIQITSSTFTSHYATD